MAVYQQAKSEPNLGINPSELDRIVSQGKDTGWSDYKSEPNLRINSSRQEMALFHKVIALGGPHVCSESDHGPDLPSPGPERQLTSSQLYQSCHHSHVKSELYLSLSDYKSEPNLRINPSRLDMALYHKVMALGGPHVCREPDHGPDLYHLGQS